MPRAGEPVANPGEVQQEPLTLEGWSWIHSVVADHLSKTLKGAVTMAPTRIKISEITPQEVEGLWPPQALKDSLPGMESHSELQRHFEDAMPPELRRKLHRPHLWLQHEDQDFVGTEDVGRFVKITRNDLLEHLPEGGCGELSRDLTLIPSRERDVGLMVRKLTIELIAQLSQLQNATDAFGKPCIQKAGFLVDGHKGVGKSQVLNLVAMWARKNGWLVVLEPTPGRYAREIADIKRSNNGIYIQSEFAQQFLEAMSLANRQLLQEIPVDLSSYGSSAIDARSRPMELPLGLRRPVVAMAPMVTQSDRPFRRLVRAHGCTLCYTEMLLAERFARCEEYRRNALGDGVAEDDHPLVVQFAANDPALLLEAARWAQHLGADAIDLNLGCPQWKAKTGNYGAWLAADETNWPLIEAMVEICHRSIEIPVFCKIRLQPTEGATLALALRLQRAGCALLAVHGRRLESVKARRSGAADLPAISRLRKQIAMPVLANGNVRRARDILTNLNLTKCDGLMVAEQLLRDPALFQRAIGSAPSVLELAAEYCGHCLAETQRFTAWEAENVDVLRSHLRSMLCGGVGASEADPGTERLLGEATRARARYVLDWWRIQQATSVEEAVALYRERCASICPEASAGFPAPAAPPAPRQTAPSFEATPRLARGWLLSAAAAVKALAVSLYAWLWPTPCQPSAESLLVVTRRLYEPLIEKTVDTEVKAQNLSGSQRLRRIAQYRRQVRTPSPGSPETSERRSPDPGS
ncbi:unnamed protein product, partial [Effrenium voratum]